MSERFSVSRPAELLAFLLEHLHGWSRSRVKSRLRAGCVLVNGVVVTRHDHALRVSDRIEVVAMARAERHLSSGLEILYMERDLIAINKPAGLLSVPSPRDEHAHALGILREQLTRPGQPEPKLWPVHRIDRDTSGVLVFASSQKVRDAVTGAWSEADKTYAVVVDGVPHHESGTIDQPLRMDERGFRALIGAHPGAVDAITHYRVVRTGANRALLEVRIDTGRQHQIRAHLAWLGFPVSGDERYGTEGPRLGLHAHRLTLPNPHTGRPIKLEAPIPRAVLALLRDAP